MKLNMGLSLLTQVHAKKASWNAFCEVKKKENRRELAKLWGKKTSRRYIKWTQVGRIEPEREQSGWDGEWGVGCWTRRDGHQAQPMGCP